ncbi:type 1 glutamine amidotransferase domain-containing protein [Luedemannella helvata]|uniref:Type 1 glutamine amidotransferase domain-containing protein n=1 Tax=Luedemannella helvata TaxID=349315 RepID=A0ABN2JQY6_9ACTN
MGTVAFLVSGEGIEEVELTQPWQAVSEAGHQPRLVAPEKGEVQAFRHLDRAGRYPVDVVAADAHAADYDALVLPGGVANGDALRLETEAVRLVREFFDAGKPVAVICHGGWVLIEAGEVGGRKLTSWPTLQTDFRNAGATWVDAEVVVDRAAAGGVHRAGAASTLISSRKPDDLPAFCRELVNALA